MFIRDLLLFLPWDGFKYTVSRLNGKDNVFLPFYSAKKGSDANLGLGLSVSYGIVKKYKGNIAVKNLKGSGCEITVTLFQ